MSWHKGQECVGTVGYRTMDELACDWALLDNRQYPVCNA